MANEQPTAGQIPDDVTFSPPASAPAAGSSDMSDVTFTPPSGDDVTARHARAANPDANYGSSDSGGVLENVAEGVAKGAGETALGVQKLAGVHPSGVYGDLDTSADNRSQGVGKGLENVAEFMSGDSLIGRAAKLIDASKTAPGIGDLVKLAETHKWAANILEEGIKGGVVGGTQGAVKGAAGAESKTKETAEGGAIGGSFGGTLGATAAEAAAPIAESLGKTFGIGTEGTADAIKGARPGKRNYKFAENFQRAAPYLDAENAASPAKTVEDWADHAESARNNLYQQKIQPLIDAHATEPVGGINIANSIRNQISPEMKTEDPVEAAKMEEIANRFMPQQNFNLQMQDAENRLQYYNAKLAKTGFWSKLPQERSALLKTDGNIAGLKAAADGLKDEFYNRLGQLEPGSDIASLKKDYGALRNVEDEIRGRVNINDRQSPISLKETIGLITGLGHGGPVGAAMAAIPFLDRWGNSPENLIASGVQKVARPGEEGIIGKAAQATGRAAKKGIPKASAAAGSQAGQAMEDRIMFKASDGSLHSIPNNENAIAHARSIDSGLELIQP